MAMREISLATLDSVFGKCSTGGVAMAGAAAPCGKILAVSISGAATGMLNALGVCTFTVNCGAATGVGLEATGDGTVNGFRAGGAVNLKTSALYDGRFWGCKNSSAALVIGLRFSTSVVFS